MESQKVKSIYAMGAVLVLLGLSGAVSPGWAEVVCGDTIGPSERVKLTKDLFCPGDDPALTVIGPAVELDMNGKTLDCDGMGNNGIELMGEKAKLLNGTVTKCKEGVVVKGTGRNLIEKVTVTKSDEDGFQVEDGSDKNHFRGNTAWKNGVVDAISGDGFDILSDDNYFKDNTSNENADDGFDVNGGNGNRFEYNLAQDNDQDGFDVDTTGGGGNGNFFIKNRAISNDNDEGFDIDGNRNWAFKNTARGNGSGDGDQGFEIDGDDNIVKYNLSEDNMGEGFNMESGTGYFVIGNRAYRNGTDGIRFDENAIESVIFYNRAFDNADFDLADLNFPDCDDNVWAKNRFGTSNQACID